MEAKEFLRTKLDINLSEVAKRMWPNNPSAKTYLSAKLNGHRPWTDTDTARVKVILKDMYQQGLNEIDLLM